MPLRIFKRLGLPGGVSWSVIALLLFGGVAHAAGGNPETAGEFFEKCHSDLRSCAYYIKGVIDGAMFAQTLSTGRPINPLCFNPSDTYVEAGQACYDYLASLVAKHALPLSGNNLFLLEAFLSTRYGCRPGEQPQKMRPPPPLQ